MCQIGNNMSSISDMEKNFLELRLQLANLKIELLTKRVKELEEKVTQLENTTESSFKTAAYNPRGITEARDNKTNSGSGNTR